MPKEVIHLTRLFHPHGGGVEKHVYKVSQELIRRGYRVRVITWQHDPKLSIREVVDKIEVIRIPNEFGNSKLKTWKWMWQHRKIIWASSVLHIHDVFWWYLPLRFIKLRYKVYTTFHGYEGSDPPSWRAVLHRKMVEWLSHKTICVGEFMRRWYRANPNTIIYGAGKLPKIANHSRGGKQGDKVIFTGRLDYDTGIMTYLKLLYRLRDLGVLLEMDVYGVGPRLKEAEAYANRRDIEVNFRGWVDDVENYYPNYNLAFVSRYLSIIEAMQAKLLVVAVYNNEIKKDYLTCHPMSDNMIIGNDPDDIAIKLSQLDEQNYVKMIDKSYTWVKCQTWDKLADKYVRLWDF